MDFCRLFSAILSFLLLVSVGFISIFSAASLFIATSRQFLNCHRGILWRVFSFQCLILMVMTTWIPKQQLRDLFVKRFKYNYAWTHFIWRLEIISA